MAANDHTCPDCGSCLCEADDEDAYECRECDGTIPAKVAKNADDLRDLADSDLPAAWVADALLGVS